MARVLIVTEKYLKENSVVNDNADMKVITPIIFAVQDFKIHPLLGSDLFDEICGQIDSNTVTAANQMLLNNYVLPCLVMYTLCDISPAMKYRYMNKGVMVKNSENSSAADLQEIGFMMDFWKNKAEEYAERATKFLCKNSTTYPLYVANPDLDDIKPNRTNYTSGLYLEDPEDDCKRRFYS